MKLESKLWLLLPLILFSFGALMLTPLIQPATIFPQATATLQVSDKGSCQITSVSPTNPMTREEVSIEMRYSVNTTQTTYGYLVDKKTGNTIWHSYSVSAGTHTKTVTHTFDVAGSHKLVLQLADNTANVWASDTRTIDVRQYQLSNPALSTDKVQVTTASPHYVGDTISLESTATCNKYSPSSWTGTLEVSLQDTNGNKITTIHSEPAEIAPGKQATKSYSWTIPSTLDPGTYVINSTWQGSGNCETQFSILTTNVSSQGKVSFFPLFKIPLPIKYFNIIAIALMASGACLSIVVSNRIGLINIGGEM